MKKQDRQPLPFLLAALGLVAFLITGIVNAPASLLSVFVDAEKTNLSYGDISGTIWRGEISDVASAGIFLGQIEYTLSPTSILGLQPALSVVMKEGAIKGNTHLQFGFGSTIKLTDTEASVNLGAIAPTGVFGEPAYGTAKISISRVVYTPRSGCLEAAGTLWTDVLNAPAERFELPALPMSGQLTCADGALSADLAGENVRAGATIDVTVHADLTYDIQATATSNEAEIASALRYFGFEDDNGKMVYGSAGIFKGAGS